MSLRNFAVALLVVLGCVLALIGQETKPKAVKYALIVGVDKYEDSKRLPKLQFAEADANSLNDLLKEKGFQTILLVGENASKAKIEAAFQAIVKKGTGDDTLLVAFSGHGHQFKPPGGKEVEPFLCTRDCNALDSATQVAFNEMLSDAGSSKVGKALFLIDACRVDPDPNKGSSGLDGHAVKVKAQTVALFAASNGQKAREHPDAAGTGNGHGLFMSEVLSALGGEAKNRRGTVTWNGLVNHIAGEVTPKSKTLFPNLPENQHQTPHSIGSLAGDAVLVEVEVAARKGGDEVSFEIADGVKMVFCWIPKGKATLGSPETEKDRNDDEKEHEFATEGFWLAKTECTQKEWESVMGENPSYFSASGDGKARVQGMATGNFPVETVSWDDTQLFLKKLNARGGVSKAFGKAVAFKLPNEDQWEYAYRGGKGNKQAFYWGDSLNGDKANCNGNFLYGTESKGAYLERTSAVGSYTKSDPHAWGLSDMSGNVWEWCDNLYSSGSFRV